jgi:hypothetical protein
MPYELAFVANLEPTAAQIESFQHLSKMLDEWTDHIVGRVTELLSGYEFTDLPKAEKFIERTLVA